MCGRYSVEVRARDFIRDRLRATDRTEPDLWGRYNVAPQQVIPVLRGEDATALEAVPMVWGYVPGFVKEEKPKSAPINARAETVATNAYFRTAFKSRRCLIPATGYYEWQVIGGGKQPHNIHRGDHEPFLMAGIWDHWHDHDRVAIITTDAASNLSAIHNRMPVMVGLDDIERWLEGSDVGPLLHPAVPSEFVADPVSRDVGNVRNQGAHLIEPTAR